MFVRKLDKENYYLCNSRANKGSVGNKPFKSTFLIRSNDSGTAGIFNRITLPKEFIGKRVRFQVIEVD